MRILTQEIINGCYCSTIKYFIKYRAEISFIYKLRYLKKILFYLVLNLIALFNLSENIIYLTLL